jgi:thiol-disulfide isomerase/thioredoxin
MNRSRILTVLGGLVLVVFVLSLLAPLLRGHSLEGELAPDFSLPVGDSDSERVRLADQRGKVVVLDFWASWCGPCKHSVPLLNRIAQRYPEQVAVYGINSEPLAPGQLGFVALRWGMTYPVLRDSALEAQLAYAVQAFPTVVLIDREGKVAKVYQGEPTEAAIDGRIKNLLR